MYQRGLLSSKLNLKNVNSFLYNLRCSVCGADFIGRRFGEFFFTVLVVCIEFFIDF